MKLIVGLGNPGVRYRFSRHNVGFLVIDRLAQQYGIDVGRKTFGTYLGQGKIGDVSILLTKPQCFMNRSGIPVRKLFDYYKLTNFEDVIVVHDELDLPFTTLKLKAGGGHGGHKGLISIISNLDSESFTRVRVGIGRPSDKVMVEGHVLGSFSEMEMNIIPHIIKNAVDAVAEIVLSGIHAAMNIYNGKKINNFIEEV